MKSLIILSSMLLVANTTTSFVAPEESNIFENIFAEAIMEESLLEAHKTPVAIDAIKVYEVEEAIELHFDTTDYLPEGFNALKGKHDLDWSTIEIIEIEDEIVLGFDTKDYLPENFNTNKLLVKSRSVCKSIK